MNVELLSREQTVKRLSSVEGIGAGCSACYQIRCVSAKGRVGVVLGEDGVVESLAAEIGNVLYERHD